MRAAQSHGMPAGNPTLPIVPSRREAAPELGSDARGFPGTYGISAQNSEAWPERAKTRRRAPAGRAGTIAVPSRVKAGMR